MRKRILPVVSQEMGERIERLRPKFKMKWLSFFSTLPRFEEYLIMGGGGETLRNERRGAETDSLLSLKRVNVVKTLH